MGIFETSKLTKACELSVMTFVVLDPQNYTNLHESCVFLKWGCPTRCPPLRRKLRKSFGKLRKLYDNFQSKLQKNCRRLQGNCIPPSWEWLPSHFVRDFFKMTSTSSRLKKWAVQTQETHHPLFSSPCGGRTAKTSLSSLEKRGEIPCISHSPRNPFLHR